ALFFGAIFGGAGEPGVGSLGLAVIDEDQTDASRALVERLEKSKSLRVETLSIDEARDKVRMGKLVAYVILPKGFEKANPFLGSTAPPIQVGIDPARRAEAGYIQGILTETFFARLRESFPRAQAQPIRIEQVDISPDQRRPRSAFEITFPSSILWG